jgi:tRNA pseudouridine38-40 synthase
MLLGEGIYRGRIILSREAVALMCSPHSVTNPDTGDFNYGLHVWVAREGSDFLFNGMFGQNVWIDPKRRIAVALNAHLPEDIAVYDAMMVDGDFHPRYDVVYKEYVYRIYNSPCRSPFEKDRAWHYPKRISDQALAAMQEAANAFCGTHDFTSFMAQGSTVAHAVRTVTHASVTRCGDVIEFHVAADGFLYNMVRIMTGTLIAVAEGKIAPEQILEIIDAKDRARAGMTAPAHGLYLHRVEYRDIPKEST